MTNMGTKGRQDARGHFYRYDPEVTADAVKVSLEFLDHHLPAPMRK